MTISSGRSRRELPVAPELAELLLARRRRPVAAARRRPARVAARDRAAVERLVELVPVELEPAAQGGAGAAAPGPPLLALDDAGRLAVEVGALAAGGRAHRPRLEREAGLDAGPADGGVALERGERAIGAPAGRHAASRVRRVLRGGAELLRGPRRRGRRPRSALRSRRRRGSSTSTSTPITTARSSRSSASRTTSSSRCSPGSTAPGSGSTCAGTRVHIRGSAPRTSCRSCRSGPSRCPRRARRRWRWRAGSGRSWASRSSSTASSGEAAVRRSSAAAGRTSSGGGSTQASSSRTSGRARSIPAPAASSSARGGR